MPGGRVGERGSTFTDNLWDKEEEEEGEGEGEGGGKRRERVI